MFTSKLRHLYATADSEADAIPSGLHLQWENAVATIDQRFKDIVIEELGVSSDQVVDSANFVTDLGADSLDLVELLDTTEAEFQIEIPVDAAEKLLTVGEAVTYITKQSDR